MLEKRGEIRYNKGELLCGRGTAQGTYYGPKRCGCEKSKGPAEQREKENGRMEGKEKKNFKTRVMELVGGSVYWRIFIAMAAFFALLAVGLVFWISGVLGQNQRMQLNTGSLHRMETISLLVDQSLENTAQSMSQLMWNNEMTGFKTQTSSSNS